MFRVFFVFLGVSRFFVGFLWFLVMFLVLLRVSCGFCSGFLGVWGGFSRFFVDFLFFCGVCSAGSFMGFL